MHLVIQFQLLLWVGDQPWHWVLKFGFYISVTLAILTVTYHFLVRPTWIGWLLNGRMFPILSFGKSPSAVEQTRRAEKARIPDPHLLRPDTVKSCDEEDGQQLAS